MLIDQATLQLQHLRFSCCRYTVRRVLAFQSPEHTVHHSPRPARSPSVPAARRIHEKMRQGSERAANATTSNSYTRSPSMAYEMVECTSKHPDNRTTATESFYLTPSLLLTLLRALYSYTPPFGQRCSFPIRVGSTGSQATCSDGTAENPDTGKCFWALPEGKRDLEPGEAEQYVLPELGIKEGSLM